MLRNRSKIALICCTLLLSCNSTQIPDAFTAEQARLFAQEKWSTVPDLVEKIQTPNISKVYLRTIRAEGEIDYRPILQAAIDSCHLAGGGRINISPGIYNIRGPLHLRSSVHLHLQEDATLMFSDDFQDYLPLVKVRWEGTVCWNYSPLIYAYQQDHIHLSGMGTINGNGKNWSVAWRKMQDPDKKRLRQMGNDLVPENERVFGTGFLDLDGDGKDDGFGDGKIHYLRPTLVEFYECQNILIEDLTFRNAPFWTIHPVFCSSVQCKNLKIFGGYLNDDGIDPDSSEGVLIDSCYIETHDDAIAIKAGRDQDAWSRLGTKNIIIRNCTLNSGVNSFAIGSEMSGGVENVFVQNCHLAQGRHGLNFKTNLDRGGTVKDIFFRDITVDSLAEALFIFRMDYHGYRGNHFPTNFSGFYAQNIRAKNGGKVVFKIVGVEDAPISQVYLENISVDQAITNYELAYAEEIIFEQVRIKQENILIE